MKLRTIFVALMLTVSTALQAAPSEGARTLFTNLKLDEFASMYSDSALRHPGLSAENETILRKEFSSESFQNAVCEHFDKTYSEAELKEFNDLWKLPAMQKLASELMGKNAGLHKAAGEWTRQYAQRIQALKSSQKN